MGQIEKKDMRKRGMREIEGEKNRKPGIDIEYSEKKSFWGREKLINLG